MRSLDYSYHFIFDTKTITVEEGTGIGPSPQPSPKWEGAVYDLAGRCLNSKFKIQNSKLPKGIYVIGEKKVIY